MWWTLQSALILPIYTYPFVLTWSFLWILDESGMSYICFPWHRMMLKWPSYLTVTLQGTLSHPYVSQSHGPIMRKVLGQRLNSGGQKQTESVSRGKLRKQRAKGPAKQNHSYEQGFPQGWPCILGFRQGPRQPFKKTLISEGLVSGFLHPFLRCSSWLLRLNSPLPRGPCTESRYTWK